MDDIRKVYTAVFVPWKSGVINLPAEPGDDCFKAPAHAAMKAYAQHAIGGIIPVLRYPDGLDGTVEEALTYETRTPGHNLLLLIVELSGDRERVEDLLAGIGGNCLVVVPVGEAWNRAWVEQLRGMDNVDVLSVGDLRNPATAGRKVGPWTTAQ